MFGGRFTTRPIQDHAKSCELKDNAATPCPEVQYALMDLPNFAIPEVEVDAMQYIKAGKDALETTTSLYTVQFTDASNSGKQNTLECEVIDDTTVNGAQPKYGGVAECAVYNVGGPEWFAESGEKLTLNLKGKFPEVTTPQTRTLI